MSRFVKTALAAALIAPNVLCENLFVSHLTGKVYTLTYEASSSGNGTLSIDASATRCGNMPTWLTLDRASKTLYCFDESSNSGVVSSFEVDSSSVKSTGQANTAGADVHGWLYGGSDGQGFLSTAQYDDSSITTYKLPLTSSTKVLQKLSFTMSGPGPDPSRQDAPHPHSTITDPTGKYLIVPDLGADLIRIFSIDASSGKLTTCTPAKAGAGDGPRHGSWWAPKATSTDGLMLYTVNELGNSVTGWKVTYPKSGCLTLNKTQTLSTFESGTPPSSSMPVKAAEVHVRDNFLYAANRNDQTFGSGQDSLVRYNISSTGILDFVEATNAHAWYPRTFSINEAGDKVAVGGQTSSNVAIIARDTKTGKLGDLLASINVATAGHDGQEDGLSAVVWNNSSSMNLRITA